MKTISLFSQLNELEKNETLLRKEFQAFLDRWQESTSSIDCSIKRIFLLNISTAEDDQYAVNRRLYLELGSNFLVESIENDFGPFESTYTDVMDISVLRLLNLVPIIPEAFQKTVNAIKEEKDNIKAEIESLKRLLKK